MDNDDDYDDNDDVQRPSDDVVVVVDYACISRVNLSGFSNGTEFPAAKVPGATSSACTLVIDLDLGQV